ncbi:MAG: hypothetical protein QOC66_1170, partial [Pseudonocardiales bacterium]|nr:hypothetical protein [Pseudonocardiales bacterium]
MMDTTAAPQAQRSCRHIPACPTADDADRDAA